MRAYGYRFLLKLQPTRVKCELAAKNHSHHKAERQDPPLGKQEIAGCPDARVAALHHVRQLSLMDVSYDDELSSVKRLRTS